MRILPDLTSGSLKYAPEDILRNIFEVHSHELLMATDAAIRGLEVRDGSPAVAAVQSIIDRSREVFNGSARPSVLYETLAITDFDQIYRGRGDNDDDTPLEHVIDEAVALALFAVTLGDQISDHIHSLFDAGELAEGYILDKVASFAADELADIAARRFQTDSARSDLAVLPYSPGYCGWHVSGQRALFSHLRPDEIGISLNDSCLMHPIKSVSGVLVLAPVEAHEFSPAFPCCATCTTLDCQERAASLKSRGV
jgi:hypothetical protein